MTIILGKGEIAEEVLKRYFIEQGYFVVRSLPFAYNKIDITDVDLWLYNKASAFTRERTAVDIKNKNTPQAFERIIWVKGLQVSLGLERAIVATTSVRKEVRDFGLSHDVIVLDGNLLSHLTAKEVGTDRITEEVFSAGISDESFGKEEHNWKERYRSSKSRLLNKFNFDGCNEYLTEICYFLEQTMLREDSLTNSLRLLYINIAFFLICVDFLSRNYTSMDQKSRFGILEDGFNYGERGKERTESITDAAIKLASSVIANPGIAKTLKSAIDKQRSNRPVEILAEFFSRASIINSLFETANLFELSSYSQQVLTPSNSPTEMQSVIGLLIDFFQMDRRRILSL